MNTEDQAKTASRHLTYAIAAIALFEFILIGIAVAVFAYAIRGDIQIPFEPFFFAIIILGLIGAVPILLLAERLKNLETMFWKEVAEQYGYGYVHRPYFQDTALIFQEGRERATGHGLTGTLSNYPFRFFQYRYSTGLGNHRKTHTYDVFEIVFSGTFPHIYLNNTRNRDLSKMKGVFLPRISLPHELEQNFNLHVPHEYEIEALEIFTPDFLSHLLDVQWEHDLELVDQKLYIFREKSTRSKQELAAELQRLEKILALLAPKLNRLKLTPIGDLKTTL